MNEFRNVVKGESYFVGVGRGGGSGKLLRSVRVSLIVGFDAWVGVGNIKE